MSDAPHPGTDGVRALAVEAARRYYLEDLSKSEIGQLLGISRFKVARLLQQARAEGWVRIEIAAADSGDEELADRVRTTYGLERVVVTDSDGDLTAQVGRGAARLLGELLTTRDVLGLPWARTVSAVVDALTDLPPVPVVQLSGSLVIPGESSPVDLVRGAARLAGGEAHVYYAPLILSDAAGAEVIRAHPDVVEAHRHIADVTIALVSIGAWAPGQSTIHDAVDEATRARLSADGVVGEVVGVCFDAEGALVEPGLTDRLVAVTAEELRGVDRVVALASRAQRAEATAACLRTGLVDVLVVDRSLARRLLDPA